MIHKLNLLIGGIFIQIQSPYPNEEPRPAHFRKNIARFFVPPSPGKPEIRIQIERLKRPFPFPSKSTVFQTVRDHPSFSRSRRVIWKLAKKGDCYILAGNYWGKGIASEVSEDFGEATVFLNGQKELQETLRISDITHDFLQILLIHYLAQKEKGILLHATGVGDGRKGFLFYGPTRSGKTTLARLWRRHTPAHILGDDRILVRREEKQFFIHATPWSGEFKEYCEREQTFAELSRAFFLQGHSPSNRSQPLSARERFESLFPQCFLPFWNRPAVDFVSRFLADLSAAVPIEGLEFKDDEKVIDYVRSLSQQKTRRAALPV